MSLKQPVELIPLSLSLSANPGCLAVCLLPEVEMVPKVPKNVRSRRHLIQKTIRTNTEHRRYVRVVLYWSVNSEDGGLMGWLVFCTRFTLARQRERGVHCYVKHSAKQTFENTATPPVPFHPLPIALTGARDVTINQGTGKGVKVFVCQRFEEETRANACSMGVLFNVFWFAEKKCDLVRMRRRALCNKYHHYSANKTSTSTSHSRVCHQKLIGWHVCAHINTRMCSIFAQEHPLSVAAQTAQHNTRNLCGRVRRAKYQMTGGGCGRDALVLVGACAEATSPSIYWYELLTWHVCNVLELRAQHI